MSTGVGMSTCCLSGQVHDGTPAGKIETIDNLQTYVAAPKDGSTAKTIVFLVDIFGWEFKNVRLLADNYAKAGFYCYIPDVHQGDSIPLELLNSVEPPLKTREQLTMIDKTKATAAVGVTLPPWLMKHREAVSRPLIESFINTIRQVPGTSKVGAIGFCWGGRYAILAAHGVVDAAYACHPSLVDVPGDFEGVAKPLSLAVGDSDSLLDNGTVSQIQDIIAKKTELPHELRIYKDQVHGFALRSDWSSEKDKKAMDDAEKQGVEWFNKYLA
ncbi:dienelactone hydrolase family protein-like protein [Leptodontidium sp. MPI-SDFR-AT-0119]|nr:dienelactone hydrolase family protein-like protein [Leptodontidium sp. MPI-SDFR-AT-0119]